MISCVMGPSGSGKSTLAKRLQAVRPDLFARVPVDYFFVPRESGTPVPDYLARPFAYDWAVLDQALSAEGEPRSTPDCDFETMQWRSPHGGLPIATAPILVLDGMRPHPRCDRLVLLELDPTEQRRRLLDRDRRWGTNVADRDDHLAATFRQGCAEAPRPPDLRLDAAAPLESNALTLIDFLS
jgi:energy-coupling factor transporter ATP-binding protein EcfA2